MSCQTNLVFLAMLMDRKWNIIIEAFYLNELIQGFEKKRNVTLNIAILI
jgi:hypothetical protein